MSAHNHLQEGLIADYELPETSNGGGIILDRSPAVCSIRTSGAETRKLDSPLAVGSRLTITLSDDGGDCVITADDPINQAGNTVITLADVGDTVDLVSTNVGGSPVWRVVANDGASLS